MRNQIDNLASEEGRSEANRPIPASSEVDEVVKTILGDRPQYDLRLLSAVMAYAEVACPGVSHRVSMADGMAILSGVFRAVSISEIGGSRIFDPSVPLPAVRTGPPSSLLLEVGKALSTRQTVSTVASPSTKGKKEEAPSRKTKRAGGGRGKGSGGPSAPGVAKEPTKRAKTAPPVPDEITVKRNRLLKRALRSFRSKAWGPIVQRLAISEDDVEDAVAGASDELVSGSQADPPLERLGLIDWDRLFKESWADHDLSSQLVEAARRKFASAAAEMGNKLITDAALAAPNSPSPSTGTREELVNFLRKDFSRVHRPTYADVTRGGPLVTIKQVTTGENSPFLALTYTVKRSGSEPTLRLKYKAQFYSRDGRSAFRYVVDNHFVAGGVPYVALEGPPGKAGKLPSSPGKTGKGVAGPSAT